MVAFLDIEGAFNNIQLQAILNELDNLGVHPLLKSVIDQDNTGFPNYPKIGC